MSNPREYEGWISVFDTSTDFEADLVRDRLDAAGIPAVVFTQRDHAFNLTLGDLAAVHVMVPPERLAEARDLVVGQGVTDEELEAQAMAADPEAPAEHSPQEEAMLDSGIEEIRLSAPDDVPPSDEPLSDASPSDEPYPGERPL